MFTFGLILLIPVLFIAALYWAAKNNWHATFVPEDQFKFVVHGESLGRVLDNTPNRPRQTFLQKKFGLYWVSIFFPLRRVHRFEIEANSLKNETERAGKPVTEWIEHEDRLVDSLLWRIPRPFLLRNVELKDRLTINVIVYAVFEVVHPEIPVFTFRGKFFEQLDTVVEGNTIDFINNMTYAEFVEKDRGKGQGPFWEHLEKINEYTPPTPDGIASRDSIEEEFGIKVIDAWIVSYDLSEEDAGLIAATKAQERERLNAEGVREAAKGTRDARMLNAEGEAERYQKLLEALVAKGVDPNMAAEVLRTQLQTENVRDSSLNTWVTGSSALPTIPVTSGDRTREED